MMYKYDFHCHINEGSKDSKVSAKEHIEALIKKGFTGCLITDHNTFDGYEYIKEHFDNRYLDFYILKSIEYSTIDAGHIIIIMPDEYDSKKLEIKGVTLNELVTYVHSNGGILGPAHPFSEPYLSIFSSKKYKNNYDICKQFDFIEVLNAGEKQKENAKALEVSNKYNLFKTSGSDSHYLQHCGFAYIEVNELIKTNNQLIDYIKSNKPASFGGNIYRNYDREKYDKFFGLAYLFDHYQIERSKNCW